MLEQENWNLGKKYSCDKKQAHNLFAKRYSEHFEQIYFPVENEPLDTRVIIKVRATPYTLKNNYHGQKHALNILLETNWIN